MTTILTEFRQATRRSAGSPGYSLGVFLTLSPALYVLGIGGVLLAALLASVMPAWRAARVQPMAALRYE